MEFNVGDIVRIRQDLNMETIYENICVVSPMMDMCKENKEWVISEKQYTYLSVNTYQLAGQDCYDDGVFIWTAAMLEPAGNEIEVSQSELADFLGI